MTEKFEYKGEWFLPSNKNHRISGTLYYDIHNGCTLELYGDFDETESFLQKSVAEYEYDIILGLTSHSKEITLYRTFIIQKNICQKTLCKYSVQYIFEDVHIDKAEDIKFDTLLCEFANMDEWVGINGFIYPSVKETEEMHKNKEYQIKYKLPERIIFPLCNDLEGHFNFVMNLSGWKLYQKNVSMEQKVQFILKYKNERPFKEILNDLHKFHSFLVLCLYSSTYPHGIIFQNTKMTINYENDFVVDRQIKLYYTTSVPNTEKQKMFTNMLFCYGEIQNDFSKMIKTWFENYEILKSPINLLTEQFFNDNRFSENNFLNLAQAAESFHAHTMDRCKKPKSEYEQMKKDILSKVESKYKEWLTEQFEFGNKLNLHTRMEEIISFCSCVMIDKMINDKNKFVKDVKNSRNYYTHYSTQLINKALKDVNLYYLSNKLKMLLTCALLINVGLDKNLINETLEQKKYYFFNSFGIDVE